MTPCIILLRQSRDNHAPEGQDIDDRAGGPSRILPSVVSITGMSGTMQYTGSAAGSLSQTLDMDLPLSESDEGRSLLTFDIPA